jgi:hypothetical protein
MNGGQESSVTRDNSETPPFVADAPLRYVQLG